MSKSNALSPGAYEVLNGTTCQVTSLGVKPRPSATAYATAASKPCPFDGSSSAKYGGYAGVSVPIVNVSAPTVVRFSREHSSVACAGSEGAAAEGATEGAAAEGAGALLDAVVVSAAQAARSSTVAATEITGTNRLRMVIASPLLSSRPLPEGTFIVSYVGSARMRGAKMTPTTAITAEMIHRSA